MKILNISISQIMKCLNGGGGRIYLWGAGKAFDNFIPKLAGNVDFSTINGIVDSVQTGFRNIGGRTIPIISPDNFLCMVADKDILIITTSRCEEVLSFLQSNDTRNIIRVVIYYMLYGKELEDQRDVIRIPNTFKTAKSPLIPKKIHYCWFGKNPIPDQYKKWMDSWKKYCPDYEIIEWNESNYDIHKIKYVEQAYMAKKWAFVTDYVRLDVIYNYGGIYLDTDVELIRNIDELLYNKAFCGFESSDFVAFGLGFGSVVNNNIIKEIMQVYETKPFIDNEKNMDMTPCPVVQTDILERRGLKRNGEYQIIDDMAILPELVLNPFNTRTLTLAKDLTNSFMIHHYTASWAPDYAKKLEERRRFLEKFLDYFIDSKES